MKKTEPINDEQVKFTDVKTDTVERATDKQGKMEVASFVWTLISSVYTIGTVIFFVANNWVPSEFNGALIGLLVVWIVAFVVIIALAFSKRDVGTGQKALKIYKKAIKIFKSLVSLLFIIITAVSMAGVVQGDINGFVQWLMLAVTFAVAFVQLAIKIALIVMKLVFKHKGRGKSVEVVTFVNGKEKQNKVQSKFMQKLYHSEDD